jgi:hypothetical protein
MKSHMARMRCACPYRGTAHGAPPYEGGCAVVGANPRPQDRTLPPRCWPTVTLPALTGSRLPDSGTSGELDRSVRELLRAALAIYELDVGLLAKLEPDLVVTQDLCQVCAVVSHDAVCAAADQLAVANGG